jgi:hypothetical protein
MAKSNFSSHQYNKSNNSTFYFYSNSFVDNFSLFTRALSSSTQFNTELCKAFTEASAIYFSEIFKYNKSWHDPFELDKILRGKFRKVFDQKFREEKFVHILSDAVANYSELAEITRTGKMYQHLSNRLSAWNNDFVEPIRDTLYRTPSTKIVELEKYSLFHYKEPLSSVAVANTNNIHLPPPTHSSTQRGDQAINQQDSKERISSLSSSPSIPVLVIYAFINRHYILDLLPDVSVVRNLLNQGGLDIFATDWGTPSVYDKSLTIGHFVNSYIDKSVDLIRKIIRNKMRIEDTYNSNNECNGKIVNLKNITMPFLNVVAQKDDLVAPTSSKALNDALTESRDKSIIEFNSGHVGLMIGKNAHKELWPKVGEWIKYHS